MKDLKDLTLITDVTKLDGTCYIELQPGVFKNEFWSNGSAYIDPEHHQYDVLEDLFEKYFKNFDPFSYQTYSKNEWLEFINLLQSTNSDKIPSSFVEGLSVWLKNIFKKNNDVTFMGL